MMTNLPLDLIDIRDDARVINETTVSALADSIAEVGVINPIRIRKKGDRWEVVAGAHRLSACKLIGLAEVTCLLVQDDDLHAELAMIDENLCRSELSPADRARHTARRKVIYEELHPDTRHGAIGNGREKSRQFGDSTSADRFTAETANTLGRSERAVQRDVERGAKVIEEVLDMVRGTKLDTGAYLDKLKVLSPNDQVQAARRDLANLKSQERAKPDETSKSRQARVDGDVKQRAAREVAEMIAEHFSSELWDAVKANLYAAGASNIAHELTNITGQSIMDRRYA